MFNSMSIGVSLQHGHARAVLLKDSLRGTTLLDSENRELKGKSGLSDAAEAINELVRDIVERNGVRQAALCVALPEDMITLRFIELPSAVKENLKGTLNYELNKYVPLTPEEVCFDCQIAGEDAEKNTIQVLLVLIKKALLYPLLDIGADGVTTLSRVEIASTATANFLYRSGAAKVSEPLYMLGSSREKLVFSVIEKGRIRYLSKIAFSENGAEADPAAKQQMQHAIDETVEAFGPIRRCYCPNHLPGAVSNLLADFDIERLPVDFASFNLPDDAYIPAYGLAANVLGADPNTINLLPEDRQIKPSKAGQYAMIGLAAALLVSLMLYGGGLFLRHKAAMDQLDAQIAKLEQQIETTRHIQKRYNDVASSLDYLGGFVGEAPVVKVLTELSVMLPDDTWLNEFTLTGSEVKVVGMSSAASKLIPLLESSSMFDNARFLSTIRKVQDGKERFHIGVEIEKS